MQSSTVLWNFFRSDGGTTRRGMNDSAPCGQSCASCPRGGSGTVGADRAPLAEVLARFDREATRGVCDTGRYRLPYYVWGAGPPLVFIHGAADVSRSFVLVISRL